MIDGNSGAVYSVVFHKVCTSPLMGKSGQSLLLSVSSPGVYSWEEWLFLGFGTVRIAVVDVDLLVYDIYRVFAVVITPLSTLGLVASVGRSVIAPATIF